MIIEVSKETLLDAARIHAEAWREAHMEFCSPEFVAEHTVERQAAFLQRELSCGKKLYMLMEELPVGIVSIHGDLIENLYILPSEQRKGYGTKLLRFAIEQCESSPTVWVLSNNIAAKRLYKKHSFGETGNRKQLRENLFEIEMRLQ